MNFKRTALALSLTGMVFITLLPAKPKKQFIHPATGEIIIQPDKQSSKADWKRYHDFDKYIAKTTGRIDRASGIHKGNRVRTLFYNYGCIGKPNTEPSLEWPIGSNEGYGFEFGIIVGSKVRTANNSVKFILTESLDDGGDRSPGGASWGWEPLSGYHDPSRSDIAMNTSRDVDQDNKPDSWPSSWWDDYYQDYIWPGEYGYGITTADEESYWVMDDYYNKEFNRTLFDYPSEAEDPDGNEIYHSDIKDNFYYPDTTDYERGGLGLEAMCRGYQWAHTLAQDCIFFIFEMTNVGTENLDEAIFGMFGDPHVGGANDYGDDDASYDTKIDMVYAWDHDFRGDGGFRPGYFGYKFLESPGEPYDGIDNDEDGMLDESMQDGIDNDGDWMSYDDYNSNGVWDEGEDLNDDIGGDGVSPRDLHYPGPDLDGSEGNGLPDAGEPNFDETDLDEADQIGLTSFNVIGYHEIYPYEDESFYNMMNAEIIDSAFSQTTDNVFLYSSGTIKLNPGDTRRFSIALLFGYDQQDLYHSADIVQQIYNAGYRFVKAPEKPLLTAVPGNGEVTLYWDTRSELSRDPVYGFDFAGYAVYRSSDFGFNDPFVVTDAQGNPKLWKPIAKFDLVDEYEGPHPVEQINGIHYYMGDNTGLQHSFRDTTVINGMTYYYAVVAYDTGSVTNSVPPTECAKNIERTITGEIRLDDNTAMVTPRAPSAGYQPPELILSGDNSQFGGTGRISASIIDPTAIKDNQTYEIRFTDTSMDSVDNDNDGVLDTLDFEEMVRETRYYDLYNVTDPDNPDILITQSTYLNGEDHNPYIDGLKIQVWNDETSIIKNKTGWVAGNCNYSISVGIYSSGMGGVKYPADFEIIIRDTIVDQSYNRKDMAFLVTNLTTGDTADVAYFPITKTGNLLSGERVVPLLFAGSSNKGTWDIKFEAPITRAQVIYQDNSGTIWFGSNGDGMAKSSGGTWMSWNNNRSDSPDIQSNHVNAFAKHNRDIYIGTNGGINFWNSYEILTVNDEYIINEEVRALVNDPDDKLWIGTASGITIFENGRYSYDLIPGTDSLPSLNIYTMMLDSQDRIWIGTDQGISKIANGVWTPFTDLGLNSIKVITLTEINSVIYAGTEHGMAYYDGSVWVPVSTNSLPNEDILAITYYDNSIFVALSGSSDETGLYRSNLNPGNWSFERYSYDTGELTNNEVTSLFVDNLNRLTIGNKYGLDFYSIEDGWYSYNPEPGDIMRLYTRKPFSNIDVYKFTSTAASIDSDELKNEMDDIAVVPNPYIATAIWEPKPDFVVGRGERKIYFINLPNEGTIRIYTLNGELVKTILIENSIFNGAVSWNLLNKDNLEIAYGLYIYHVDTGEKGSKIGKFAIVK